MTDRPAVARLCPTCLKRFCPITQPTCDACGPDRAAVNNTKKRARPKPPKLVTAVTSSVPDEHATDLAAQLAALPEPTEADLAAYLSGAADQ